MTITTAYKFGNYLVVRIRSDEPVLQRPLHIGIMIDTSGSMGGERLNAVKRTLHAGRSLWTPTDKCTLVGFNDTATVYQENCSMDDAGANTFYTAVDSMTAEGCTNLSAGLSSLYSCSQTYDSVIILTDGVVNRGVTSIEGLQVLSRGVQSHRQVIHALGYGEDHCRTLLRHMAVAARGSYTYVDSDEILPLAIGSIVADARCEVARDIYIRMPDNYMSIEPSASPMSSSNYLVGNIISSRDYWCVFTGDGSCSSVECMAGNTVLECVDVQESSADEIQEQILRAQVATILEKTSNAIESRLPIPHGEISELLNKIATLSMPLRTRPLILTFIAQLTEANATVVATPHAASRMAAATTILTTQRGVYSTAIEEDPSALYAFCSPVQRAASQTVRNAYA